MIILFDYDSMLYKANYKIVSFGEIKEFFRIGMNREAISEEIVNKSIDRMQAMEQKIFEDIEDTGVSISEVKYFVTDCHKSLRKQISAEYKAKRKKNKWTTAIRKKILLEYSNIYRNDYFEADDLIADEANNLRANGIEYIILSLDKDLQQIEGIHYNYYTDIVEENGREIRMARGLSVTSDFESKYFFWRQMLMGDAGDGIQGLYKVGIVKATEILDGCTTESQLKLRVCRAYLDHYSHREYKGKGKKRVRVKYELDADKAREELEKNYRLLKLGTYELN